MLRKELGIPAAVSQCAAGQLLKSRTIFIEVRLLNIVCHSAAILCQQALMVEGVD